MQLSILPELSSVFGEQSPRAHLAEVKTGDRLRARIVKISPSGRTFLQFDGFKAVSEKPVGRQVGEIVHFEVLPDGENDKSRATINRSPAGAPKSFPVPRHRQEGGGFHRSLRLNALPDTLPASTHTRKVTRPLPQNSAQMGSANLLSGSPESVPLRSFQVISKWFQRLKKNRRVNGGIKAHPSSTKHGLDGTKGNSSLKSSEPHGWFEANQTERAGESPLSIGISSFYLGHSPVRIKVYGGHHGHGKNNPHMMVKAVFLLDLENTGPVRTDIKMSADHIEVCFFVESQECRRLLDRALPDLTAALSPFATRCVCHVAVSRRKIFEFMQDGEEPQLTTGLTTKA